MEVLAALGNEGARTRLVAMGGDIARQVMRSQVMPPVSDRLPNPCAALGGVRGGLLEQSIRVDYVVHAVSGWLGLERQLEAWEAEGRPVRRGEGRCCRCRRHPEVTYSRGRQMSPLPSWEKVRVKG